MARQVPVYKLKDDSGEILDGTFYENWKLKLQYTSIQMITL